MGEDLEVIETTPTSVTPPKPPRSARRFKDPDRRYLGDGVFLPSTTTAHTRTPVKKAVVVHSTTLQQLDIFIEKFRETANMKVACKEAGLLRKTVRKWLQDDRHGIQDRLADATADADDTVEEEIYRRAVVGILKPVYQGGKEVGQVREYSDNLLMFFAKGRMPGKYREDARGVAAQATANATVINVIVADGD